MERRLDTFVSAPSTSSQYYLRQMNTPTPDSRWKVISMSQERLQSLASWLKERRDIAEHSVIFHFENAGDLVEYSWFHYPFASMAFFHAVLGVERCLRVIYGDEGTPFQQLFRKAVSDRVVVDNDLSNVPPTPQAGWKWKDEPLPSYSALHSRRIPSLRNGVAHGIPMMTEELLPITQACREIADALWKSRAKGPTDREP